MGIKRWFGGKRNIIELPGLEKVPWDQLRHAYGFATDVPGLLQGLASEQAKTREESLWHLYGNVFHQGSRYEASPYVFDFLLPLLRCAELPNRADILQLLVSLAIGYDEEHLPFGIAPEQLRQEMRDLCVQMNDAQQARCDRFGDTPEAIVDCYDRAENIVPELLPMLSDEDDGVRSSAAYAIAWFPKWASKSVPALVAILEAEWSEAVQVNQLLALGLLLHQSPQEFSPSISRQLSKLCKQGRTLAVRSSAALAGGLSRHDARDITMLLGVVGTGRLCGHYDGLCFGEGDLEGIIMSFVATQAEDHETVLPHFLEALRRSDFYRALNITEAILALVFPDALDVAKTPAASLAPRQRESLEAIANHGGWYLEGGAIFANYSQLMRAHGIPDTRDQLQNYLAGARKAPTCPAL